MHPADLGPSSLPLPPPFPFPSLLSSFFHLLFSSSLLFSSRFFSPLPSPVALPLLLLLLLLPAVQQPPLPSSPSFPPFVHSPSLFLLPLLLLHLLLLLSLLPPLFPFSSSILFLPLFPSRASSVRAYTGIYRGQVSVYKVTCPALASDSNYYQRPRHHRG